ncbi:transposase [Streptomyces sp. SP17KL33]|nr:transposase [Streptomyces sp. SP17KL33]MEE1836804.1 transposase [Streptomyces sp. SP17KL33]
MRLLARRIQHLTEEINDLNKRTAEAIRARTPGLLDVHGVGPATAAALLTSAGDNPERLDSEASFAALCGTSPVEASSGKAQRRRLNRGGDRQAKAALYRIVLSRLRWAGPSQDYLRRRLAEGKTKREIIRCLKNGMSHERSIGTSPPQTPWHTPRNQPETPLDIHRGINAAAESFWALRKEEIGTRTWPDRTTTRAEVFTFIETFYNRRRLRKHRTFGHLTPIETRQRHQHALADLCGWYRRAKADQSEGQPSELTSADYGVPRIHAELRRRAAR